MVTMKNEIFDRHNQHARGELNAAISRGFGRLGHAVRNAFEVLGNIEYEAPWTAKSTKARCN